MITKGVRVMPNWSTNVLRIEKLNEKGEEPQDIINAICENEELDFNKIIPMPQVLDVPSVTTGDIAFRVYLFKNKENITEQQMNVIRNNVRDYIVKGINEATEESIQHDIDNMCSYTEGDYNTEESLLKLGEQIFNNVMTYGSMDWYAWCVKNWGTKWNANTTSVSDDEIIFETAWSPAVPIIEELSRMYPNNAFYFYYAEEQVGQYAGKGTFINGVSEDWVDYESESKELYELAFSILGWGEEYAYCEELGTYAYIDKDDEDNYVINNKTYTQEEFDNKWEWNGELETYTLKEED
jgi:hypothetical protein